MAEALFHAHYSPNHEGRDFIIGDLHGEYSQLMAALERVDFNARFDRCFSVGDLIDRGPDSIKCAQLVVKPWFHSVLGNHEQMMLRAILHNQYNLWINNGGIWVADALQAEVNEMVKRFLKLPFAITIDHASGQGLGICHAQSPVSNWAQIDDVEGDQAAVEQMLWGRSRITSKVTEPVAGIDWLFHGHTWLKKITVLGNSVFIDTGACFGGTLTLLCLDDFVATDSHSKRPSRPRQPIPDTQYHLS